MLLTFILLSFVFIVSSGVLFNRIFRNNVIIGLSTSIVASVAFIFLLIDVVDKIIDKKVQNLIPIQSPTEPQVIQPKLPVFSEPKLEPSVVSESKPEPSSAPTMSSVELPLLFSPILPERGPSELKIGMSFQDKLKDGSLAPKMVMIPKGYFEMGSNKHDSKKPVHTVTINYDFAMSQYEVTFADYDKFCGATGHEKPDDQGWGRGNRPVINMTWNDAKAYAQWLNEQTGNHYRLPTEAEWEYAARAGTQTAYSFGDDASQLGEYAWYNDNSSSKTHPVGEKKPNAFGLYDMHGNVWEWTCSTYTEQYDGNEFTCNMTNEGLGVLRGGSWYGNPDWFRSTDRIGGNYTDRSDFGFRVVISFP